MNVQCLGWRSTRRLQVRDQLFDPLNSKMIARHFCPNGSRLVLIDGYDGILGYASARVVDVAHKRGRQNGLSNFGDFPDQFVGALQIPGARLYERDHAERHDLTGSIFGATRLLHCRREMLDAALRVSRPLGHLPQHVGKPSLAGLHPGGFGSQTPFDESGGPSLASSMVHAWPCSASTK